EPLAMAQQLVDRDVVGAIDAAAERTGQQDSQQYPSQETQCEVDFQRIDQTRLEQLRIGIDAPQALDGLKLLAIFVLPRRVEPAQRLQIIRARLQRLQNRLIEPEVEAGLQRVVQEIERGPEW